MRVLNEVGDGPSAELIAERILAAFGAEDAARSAYLDRLIREGGHCRFCGAEVSDVRLAKSPGLCSKRQCQKRAARGEGPAVIAFVRAKRPGRPKGR